MKKKQPTALKINFKEILNIPGYTPDPVNGLYNCIRVPELAAANIINVNGSSGIIRVAVAHCKVPGAFRGLLGEQVILLDEASCKALKSPLKSTRAQILALIAIENARISGKFSYETSQLSGAEDVIIPEYALDYIEAGVNVGSKAARKGMARANKTVEKSVGKTVRQLHRAYVKTKKADAKAAAQSQGDDVPAADPIPGMNSTQFAAA